VEKNVLIFGGFWPIFAISCQNYKTFSTNLKCAYYPYTRRHFCAKFDVLRPFHFEISFGGKTVTHQLLSPSVNLCALH